MNNLTHGSLFSGVGGFDLGAKMSGIETIWNCECEEHNRMILKKNFPDSNQFVDIRKLSHPDYVDVISGGFPCQDISCSNQSKKILNGNKKSIGINGQRSGLWKEMFRIIREVRPKYVLIENSPRLLVRGLEYVLCDLSKIGYVCEWQCLRASQFGYNHQRERFYAIAYTNEIICVSNAYAFKELNKILLKSLPRQIDIPMPTKRFNANSDYSRVRMDDGFSTRLDKSRIEMMGNAIIPTIAHYLFECVKAHNTMCSTGIRMPLKF